MTTLFCFFIRRRHQRKQNMYQSALPPVRPNYATANAYNPGHGGGYANDPGRFGKPRIFEHKPKPKTKS